MRLGELTRHLLSAQKGWPIHGPEHVLDMISLFINLVNELHLPQTSGDLMELHRFADSLGGKLRHRNLGESEARQLVTIVSRVRETLAVESSEQLACVLIDDRFGASKLMTDVRALLGEKVFDLLPAAVRRDFADAGRCLGFELPDASALHLARALDGVVDFYYHEMTGGPALNDDRWGLDGSDLISGLEEVPDKIQREVKSLLHTLRKQSREETSVFTIQQMRELFERTAAGTAQLIGHLASRLGAREPAGAC